jgi:hypothetical protein
MEIDDEKHDEESHSAETTVCKQSRSQLTLPQKAAAGSAIQSHPMASKL